jgi:hypothetical protein
LGSLEGRDGQVILRPTSRDRLEVDEIEAGASSRVLVAGARQAALSSGRMLRIRQLPPAPSASAAL